MDSLGLGKQLVTKGEKRLWSSNAVQFFARSVISVCIISRSECLSKLHQSILFLISLVLTCECIWKLMQSLCPNPFILKRFEEAVIQICGFAGCSLKQLGTEAQSRRLFAAAVWSAASPMHSSTQANKLLSTWWCHLPILIQDRGCCRTSSACLPEHSQTLTQCGRSPSLLSLGASGTQLVPLLDFNAAGLTSAPLEHP